jgi:hypothetical protein
MLARLTLLLIALPALALAADAGGGAVKPAAQSARPATVQAAATTPTIAPPAPSAPPVDPSECRMTCAQSYYFCRAGDHADDCAGTWSECVVGCDSPNLSKSFSTEP